jgi:hypothetical protein
MYLASATLQGRHKGSSCFLWRLAAAFVPQGWSFLVGMPPRFFSRRQWFNEFLHRWQTLVFSRRCRL